MDQNNYVTLVKTGHSFFDEYFAAYLYETMVSIVSAEELNQLQPNQTLISIMFKEGEFYRHWYKNTIGPSTKLNCWNPPSRIDINW